MYSFSSYVLKEETCLLAIGNIENIVASGIVIYDETPNPTIHSVPLRDDCYKVSVLFVEQIHMNDPLPIPIKDELLILAHALKSIVEWPKRLVLLQEGHVSKF